MVVSPLRWGLGNLGFNQDGKNALKGKPGSSLTPLSPKVRRYLRVASKKHLGLKYAYKDFARPEN